MLEMTDILQRGTIDCSLHFLCLLDDLHFSFYLCHLSCWHFFELPLFIQSGLCIQDSHCLEHRDKLVHTIVMTQRSGRRSCRPRRPPGWPAYRISGKSDSFADPQAALNKRTGVLFFNANGRNKSNRAKLKTKQRLPVTLSNPRSGPRSPPCGW